MTPPPARDFVGEVDARSGLVTAGAGATLERIEREVNARGLSLGPASPAMSRLELGAFLEGPWAGLRAIPGGRLEPLCAALTVTLPSGHVVSSRAVPRSAAGPDLDALFLGGEGRFGRIESAVLRLLPLPQTLQTFGSALPSAADAVDLLLEALAAGVWLDRAQLQPRGELFALCATVIGTPGSIARDLQTLEHEARQRRGQPCAHEAAPSSTGSAEEREVSWDEVASALGAGASLELFRLSLETAVAIGAEDAGVSLAPGEAWPHAAIWSALEGAS